MTTRAAGRPSFIVAALALAAASLGLVEAAAPRTIATGTIHGTVTLPASAPGRRPSVSRPGGTSAADREQDALDRQTSVVYLDNMPRGMAGESVERKARLDQRGQRFVPHIVAIGVGGTVDFPNSDPFFHNVFSLSTTRARSTSAAMPPASRRRCASTSPGVVRVFCDIHAHMSAFIFVFAHPLLRRHRRRRPLPHRRRARRHPHAGAVERDDRPETPPGDACPTAATSRST